MRCGQVSVEEYVDALGPSMKSMSEPDFEKEISNLRAILVAAGHIVITECGERPSVGVALICLASQLLGMALLAQCQRSLPQAAIVTSSLLHGYAA